MTLSIINKQAILDGTAHTSLAPSECSKFIRMTKNELEAALGKKLPIIIWNRDRRTAGSCQQLQSLLKMRASPNEIFQALHMIESPIPFEKMQRTIRKILAGKHIQRIKTDHISIGEFEEILRQEDILDTLLKDPSLKRFHGYGWAHILRMNGTVSYRLAESYDEVIQYLSVILDATLIGISKNNPPEPPIQINEDILVDMKSWMDVLFRYQNISYTFEMIDSPSIQVSKSIFQAVACLLSFHVPGNTKVIRIEEKNGGLEISWEFVQNASFPEWCEIQIQDLKKHLFVHIVEWSYFLNWLASSLPNMLSFRVENGRIIFRLM